MTVLLGRDLREQGCLKQFFEYGEAQRAVVYQRLERMDRER
jgi:hypothetical protein